MYYSLIIIQMQRDAKRRLTHNEVERRRRDKINQWIMYMSKIIPDCAEENKTSYDNQVIQFQLYYYQVYNHFTIFCLLSFVLCPLNTLVQFILRYLLKYSWLLFKSLRRKQLKSTKSELELMMSQDITLHVEQYNINNTLNNVFFYNIVDYKYYILFTDRFLSVCILLLTDHDRFVFNQIWYHYVILAMINKSVVMPAFALQYWATLFIIRRIIQGCSI